MAVLHWLNKPNSGLIGVVHVVHNTPHSMEAANFVNWYCEEKGIWFAGSMISEEDPPKGESKESWWRDQRYDCFENLIYGEESDNPIILAHHFDDCLEEYIMCTMIRGYSGTIPYSRGRCIRPFRLWKKKDILGYAERNEIPYIEDPSNEDTKFKRNYIRHELVPQILKMNPGVYNIVRVAIRKQDEHDTQKILEK